MPLHRVGLLFGETCLGRDDVEQRTGPPGRLAGGASPTPPFLLGITMPYRLQRGPNDDSVADLTSALFVILAGGYISVSSREKGPTWRSYGCFPPSRPVCIL